jgi:hypothetical protein
MLEGHEPPAGEACLCSVVASLRCKDTPNSGWAEDFDSNVASMRMINPDLDGDVLQRFQISFDEHLVRNGDGARHAILSDSLAAAHTVLEVHGTVIDLDVGELKPSLRLDRCPSLGQHHVRIAIHSSVSILVTEPATLSRLLPVFVVRVDSYSGPNGDVLHISPRKLRPHRERQGNNTSSVRSCSGGTTMSGCAL